MFILTFFFFILAGLVFNAYLLFKSITVKQYKPSINKYFLIRSLLMAPVDVHV